ncbi:MAG TPA: FAD:protein FMN transferase [Xanthobacteraceae bacterium]
MTPPTRRRAIGITAAAAGLSLVPFGRAVKPAESLVSWRGEALGALASLQIHHPDRAFAAELVGRAVAEVRRLERIFSLYRTDSALVELNRRGVLVAPPRELVLVLGESRRIWELTGGAFDPTIQPLWSLYYRHFSSVGHDPSGPSAEALRAALAKVGLADVRFDSNRVVLGRRGMALSLNGIAQGYITDRVVEMLRVQGIAHSLVDMGEPRAIGAHAGGRPWQVGIADPDAPERIGDTLELVNKAVATSGGYGFRFDAEGRFNHILDPRSGRSPDLYKSVTVVAATATAADGLSTAFSLVGPGEIEAALRRLCDTEVRLAPARGDRFRLSAPRA